MKRMHFRNLITGIALLCLSLYGQTQPITLWGLTDGLNAGDKLYFNNNIFSINTSGAAFHMADTFLFTHPGQYPGYSAPIQATDGKLYGMVKSGGASAGGPGVIFKFDTGTQAYTILHSFIFGTTDGSNPNGTLLQASDGNLYGMCPNGGPAYNSNGGNGVIFRLNPATGAYSIIHNFTGTDGAHPNGGLIQFNGLLYGLTLDGGIYGQGVIFSIDPTNSIYKKLYDFTGALNDGAYPMGSFTVGVDSNLYGLTTSGGPGGLGTLFRFNLADSTNKVMYSFTGNGNGQNPIGTLALAQNGKLYGVASASPYGGKAIDFYYGITDSSFNIFNTFSVGAGADFNGTLFSAPNGMLYGSGVTTGGGDGIYRVDPTTNTFAALYNYGPRDGCGPRAGVCYTGGKLWGMNESCGSASWGNYEGGSFFCFNIIDSNYEIVFPFGQYNADPNYMIKGIDGKYYMSASGGYVNNDGLLLAYNPANKVLDTVHFFTDTLLNYPMNLSQAPDGMMYGLTQNVLANQISGGIFSFNPLTRAYANVHEFMTGSAIAHPANSLLPLNGQLYGTISGALVDTGIIYRFDPVSLEFDTLFEFGGASGIFPQSNLVYDGHSKLYGTTQSGGVYNLGVIFSYDTGTAAFQVLFSFNDTLGGHPLGPIAIAPNGKLFGITAYGGTGQAGVIYCFNPANSSMVVLNNLSSQTQVSETKSRLILASDGQIYGSVYGGPAMFSISPTTLAFTTLSNQFPGLLYSDIAATNCQPSYASLRDTFCQGNNFTYNGRTYSAGGTFNDTLQNVAGCDSVVTLYLSLNRRDTTIQTKSICAGDSVLFNGTWHKTSGNYSQTLTNKAGCDSMVNLALSVLAPINIQLHDTICSNDSILFNGTYYKQTGNYTAHLTSAGGCDSVVTLYLDVSNSIIVNTSQTLCSGDSILFNGTYYNATGNYSETLTNAGGCDSIINLVLTVLNPISTQLYDTICGNDSILFNGAYYNQTGNYTARFTSTTGCDSAVSLQLTVKPVFNSSSSQTITCGDSASLNGVYYHLSGTYSQTLNAVNGCDSVITLELTVTGGDTTYLKDTICNTDSILFNGTYYNTAGTYAAHLSTVNGCDSLITLQLTTHATTDSIIGYSLDSLGKTGPLFYCKDLAVFIPSFSDSVSSWYWTVGNTTLGQLDTLVAEVGSGALGNIVVNYDTTYSLCLIATSSCGTTTICDSFRIYAVSAIKPINTNNAISIYPNPANNLLYIKTEGLHAESILIYDVDGQVVAKQAFTPEIDIHNLTPGVYLLEVTAAEGVARKRWVKM